MTREGIVLAALLATLAGCAGGTGASKKGSAPSAAGLEVTKTEGSASVQTPPPSAQANGGGEAPTPPNPESDALAVDEGTFGLKRYTAGGSLEDAHVAVLYSYAKNKTDPFLEVMFIDQSVVDFPVDPGSSSWSPHAAYDGIHIHQESEELPTSSADAPVAEILAELKVKALEFLPPGASLAVRCQTVTPYHDPTSPDGTAAEADRIWAGGMFMVHRSDEDGERPNSVTDDHYTWVLVNPDTTPSGSPVPHPGQELYAMKSTDSLPMLQGPRKNILVRDSTDPQLNSFSHMDQSIPEHTAATWYTLAKEKAKPPRGNQKAAKVVPIPASAGCVVPP